MFVSQACIMIVVLQKGEVCAKFTGSHTVTCLRTPAKSHVSIKSMPYPSCGKLFNEICLLVACTGEI